MWTLSLFLAPAAVPAACGNASPPWQPLIPLNHSTRQHFHLWVALVMVFRHRNRNITHTVFLWCSYTYTLPSFVVFTFCVWDWISLCSPIFCDGFYYIHSFLKYCIGTGEVVWRSEAHTALGEDLSSIPSSQAPGTLTLVRSMPPASKGTCTHAHMSSHTCT